MSVRVTDNTDRIKSDHRTKANLFLRELLDAIMQTAEPKTPKREGHLRRDVLRQVLGLHGTLEWRKKYAAIQETKQFANYTTPGTGPQFAENAVRSTVNTKAPGIMKKVGLL